MATKETVEKVYTTELQVAEVEKESFIAILQGWRVRVYFDKFLSKDKRESVNQGRYIKVEYTGDIKDVHSMKLLPLKTL